MTLWTVTWPRRSINKVGAILNEQLLRVQQFHRLIGEKVATSVALLETDPVVDKVLAIELRALLESMRTIQRGGSHLSRRALMAIEELAEWIEAHVAGNVTEATDALADRLYVLLGDTIATGLPLAEAFNEVHRSNMTKEPQCGLNGKATKGSDYIAPNIEPLTAHNHGENE